jgi:hypothetical protein
VRSVFFLTLVLFDMGCGRGPAPSSPDYAPGPVPSVTSPAPVAERVSAPTPAPKPAVAPAPPAPSAKPIVADKVDRTPIGARSVAAMPSARAGDPLSSETSATPEIAAAEGIADPWDLPQNTPATETADDTETTTEPVIPPAAPVTAETSPAGELPPALRDATGHGARVGGSSPGERVSSGRGGRPGGPTTVVPQGE